MKKLVILWIGFLLILLDVHASDSSIASSDGDNYQSLGIQVNTVTDKGAWCWFADPRALHHENESGTINNTYIGYIDAHGAIKATQINHLTKKTNEILIRSWFQPDDHNNPTFLVLPDERVMIFYSRHTDESCFYYRISSKPGDITTLGKEFRLETKDNTTYPTPFILSDDPHHIYLCWRGIAWHPTIARLTMPDENDEVEFNWGPHQILQSQEGVGGVRPYAKYKSNGKDKIYFAYTTTHPDNQSVNWLYFNYIDVNSRSLNDINDTKLATIGSADLHIVDATSKYLNDYPDAVAEHTPYRNWLWDISILNEDMPVIAMVRISEDKESHYYYHVMWNGNEWQETFLSNAGGHFHQTPGLEKCYSGGMSIDASDPMVIYGSIPIDGENGSVYELMKFNVGHNGELVSSEQLTFNSAKNNIRPFSISGRDNELNLAWMHGNYYDWIVSSVRPDGFPTSIRTNMMLPTGIIELDKGLLFHKENSVTSQDIMQTIDVPNSKSFTVAVSLSPDYGDSCNKILDTDAFVYSIEQAEHPRPYIEVGSHKFVSSNLLANSDSWRTANRGTGGHWYEPVKLTTLQLVVTYENDVLRTYIDGLIDQSVEVKGLSLSRILTIKFKGVIHDIRIYNRSLSQHEITNIY